MEKVQQRGCGIVEAVPIQQFRFVWGQIVRFEKVPDRTMTAPGLVPGVKRPGQLGCEHCLGITTVAAAGIMVGSSRGVGDVLWGSYAPTTESSPCGGSVRRVADRSGAVGGPAQIGAQIPDLSEHFVHPVA